VTKLPLKLSDLFRYYKALPHQMAGIVELEEQLLKRVPDLFNRDQAWFKTWSQAGKQLDPIYLEPSVRIIKEWERCHLVAYADAVGIWTIGWGNTQIDGRPVKQGDKISQTKADTMLRDNVEHFATRLYTLIPAAKNYGGNQQAALLSWMYNVGPGAVEDSTLRRRLNAGESAQVVIPQELPKWDKADGKAMAGLTRRRAAEVALFVGAPPAPAPKTVLLNVPYEAQNDNASGTGYRECFSSSAAMVARYYGKIANDDAYNKFRAKYGDTTSSTAHVNALKALGLKARFITNCTSALLDAELDAGRPVMVGWLHKGPVTAPTGGGHWSVVIGRTPTAYIHNDPNGEANLTKGGYINTTKGKAIAYSRRAWLPRWLVDGPSNGWALLVSR
jgi:GH24 family phage-related lysozyme (muramidase)